MSPTQGGVGECERSVPASASEVQHLQRPAESFFNEKTQMTGEVTKHQTGPGNQKYVREDLWEIK